MHAITLREPWATLVAIGAKRIETRSRAAPDWLIGQRIAIHAAKGLTANEWHCAISEPISAAIRAAGLSLYPDVDDDDARTLLQLAFAETRGKVIATAVLVDCFMFETAPADRLGRTREVYDRPVGRVEITSQEYRFGDFTPGRYGWLLRDVQRLPEPIPARGELGIWTWQEPEGLVAA